MGNLTDKYYEELKTIIFEIKNYTCKNCGGNFTNNECNYCCSKDNNIEIELKRLDLILKNILNETTNLDDIHINKLFNLLMILNNSQDIINKFLKIFNYQQMFKNFLEETLPSLNDKSIELTELEINTIETLIYQQNENYNLTPIYQIIINKCVNKQQTVSLECFQRIIKQLSEKILKPFYKNSKCILKKYEITQKDNKHFIQYGENKAHLIYLNVDEINNMYYNRDLNILITIFHETIHGIQYKNIFHGKQQIDPLVIHETKDYILSKYIPIYYKENYENISYEIEAEYLGNILTSRYINKNLNISEINIKYQNILDHTRTLNGEITDIDTLFNEFILNHPEILEKHPQLQYLYKIENNKVIPLNEEELYNQYQSLISQDNINDEQKQKYKLLFSQYINIKGKKNG